MGLEQRSTNITTRLNVTTTAPIVGARKLQAQGNNTNYVQYNFGTSAQPGDDRRTTRGSTSTRTATRRPVRTSWRRPRSSTFNTQLFHVRYRLERGQPQVQIQVGTTANATWTNIMNNAANNRIEVIWQSGGTLQLYVNGTLAQTLTAGSGSVGAVRLGSVTSGGSSTLEYFDAFTSKRLLSPLYGP